MKAEDKAIELHDKYYQIFEPLGLDNIPNDHAKQCALICVDEIIENIKSFYSLEKDWNACEQIEADECYWEKVKEHIKQM